jgi:hypothetical protein
MKAFLQTLVLLLFLAAAQTLAQKAGSSWTKDLQVIIDSVSLDSLQTYVHQLSGDLPFLMNGSKVYIKSRNKLQPGNEYASQYLLQKLGSFGFTPFRQQFSTTGFNVLLEQRGTRRPNQKYILCAHYDDMPAGSSLAPGADDNASGTAAVIEAARIFRSFQFPYTITYAFWDEEEQGLIGSRYFAQLARSMGDSILGVINLDMIGYDSDNDFKANIHVRPVAHSAQLAQRMQDLNNEYALRLLAVIYDPGITASDHNSFWVNDYSAVLLIEDNYFNFNRFYHSIRDSINKFNELYFLQCSRLGIATVASFAVGELPVTPQLQTPAHLAVDVPARSLFGWTLAPEAVQYDLEISLVQDFSKIYLQHYDLAEAAWISAGLPNAASVYWRIRSSNRAGQSAWSAPGQIKTVPASTQSIPLQHGWNLVSSTLLPVDSSLTHMLARIQNHFDVMHDKSGRTFSFSAGAPQLNSWQAASAYWIRLNKADTLTIAGNVINTIPMAIPLASGWNHVAFLANDSLPLAQALTTVADRLLLAKNGAGHVYWPAFGIDDIQQLSQGQGLQLYLSATDTLVYPPKHNSIVNTTTLSTDPSHFIAPEATDKSAVLLMQSHILQTGDELAVYSMEHKITGAACVKNNLAAITIWGKDSFDAAAPGATTGQALYVKHWSRQTSSEKLLNIISLQDIQHSQTISSLTFQPEAVWIGQVEFQDIPNQVALAQNYPNPFNSETTIQYSIPKAALVRLEIYNSLGQCMAVLQDGMQEAGIYKSLWQGDRYAAGIYVCRLTAGDHMTIRKMVLLH